MTPISRSLITCLVFMASALIFIAKQHPQTPVRQSRAVSEPSGDTLVDLEGGTLLQVTERAQIADLEQRVHDIELTSRSVGLLTLKPGPWKRGWMATFYTGQAGINGSGTGVTASGNPVATDWTCASDPSILPLGTVIEVKFANGTQKILQCTDTGGAIKGRRLDVYVPNEHEDMQLGRQRVRIRVLRRG